MSAGSRLSLEIIAGHWRSLRRRLREHLTFKADLVRIHEFITSTGVDLCTLM
jgi:hypothetical protein